MTYTNLVECIAEAERFLKRAKELEKIKKPLEKDRFKYDFGGPLHATVRRSSMDLTRALAKLRRVE